MGVQPEGMAGEHVLATIINGLGAENLGNGFLEFLDDVEVEFSWEVLIGRSDN